MLASGNKPQIYLINRLSLTTARCQHLTGVWTRPSSAPATVISHGYTQRSLAFLRALSRASLKGSSSLFPLQVGQLHHTCMSECTRAHKPTPNTPTHTQWQAHCHPVLPTGYRDSPGPVELPLPHISQARHKHSWLSWYKTQHCEYQRGWQANPWTASKVLELTQNSQYGLNNPENGSKMIPHNVIPHELWRRQQMKFSVRICGHVLLLAVGQNLKC